MLCNQGWLYCFFLKKKENRTVIHSNFTWIKCMPWFSEGIECLLIFRHCRFFYFGMIKLGGRANMVLKLTAVRNWTSILSSMRLVLPTMKTLLRFEGNVYTFSEESWSKIIASLDNRSTLKRKNFFHHEHTLPLKIDPFVCVLCGGGGHWPKRKKTQGHKSYITL